MSGNENRLPLVEAEKLALEIVDLLRPWCDRIEVAGSIRRRRETIGDVEIVCIPKLGVCAQGLFGDQSISVNLLDERVHGLIDRGEMQLRQSTDGKTAFGERNKRLVYREFPLDLFSVLPPAQWGVLFLIRTGSWKFSKNLVTKKPYGWMPTGMQSQAGALWVNGVLIPTPEEVDVFQAIGREWIPPEQREM